jgi:HAD superfamily hydrolase (TIGR01549 family)
VVFDVGETLVNEERSWSEWADWIGVSRPVFFAALGATIAMRQDHPRVFEVLAPGFNLAQEQQAKAAAGHGWRIMAGDFYPDTAPCLHQLRSSGYRVAIAANQPVEIEEVINELNLPVDFVATSGGWGVAKPSAEFFRRIVEKTGVPAAKIAYVGDRLNNDVLPAADAGMGSVFIRRGPWGVIHATWPEVSVADLRIDSLGELAECLRPST